MVRNERDDVNRSTLPKRRTLGKPIRTVDIKAASGADPDLENQNPNGSNRSWKEDCSAFLGDARSSEAGNSIKTRKDNKRKASFPPQLDQTPFRPPLHEGILYAEGASQRFRWLDQVFDNLRNIRCPRRNAHPTTSATSGNMHTRRVQRPRGPEQAEQIRTASQYSCLDLV
eukprot:Trichotokara_eunicae@DN6152_c0_g1_i3.p1